MLVGIDGVLAKAMARGGGGVLQPVGMSGLDFADPLVAGLNLMSDGFCYFDGNNRLVHCNDAMRTMYARIGEHIQPGVDLSDVLDVALEHNVWATGNADPDAVKTQILSQRQEPGFEVKFAFHDGRHAVHREIRTPDGGAIGICRDITSDMEHEADLEMARAEAQAAQRRLQCAIDALPDGFAVEVFAQGFEQPRTLRRAPNGDIFLAESGAGRVLVFPAGAPAGSAPQVFAEGLDRPYGIAFVPADAPRHVYVAAADRYESTTYRRVGATGLALPPISLGLWWNFGDNRPFDTQREILRQRGLDAAV